MTFIIIALLLLLAVYIGTQRLSGLQTAAMVCFVLFGIVLVVFQDLTTNLAHALNVGRGTDLLFYCSLLAGLFLASNFYFRFKRNEDVNVAVIRQIAIDHVIEPSEKWKAE